MGSLLVENRHHPRPQPSSLPSIVSESALSTENIFYVPELEQEECIRLTWQTMIDSKDEHGSGSCLNTVFVGALCTHNISQKNQSQYVANTICKIQIANPTKADYQLKTQKLVEVFAWVGEYMAMPSPNTRIFVWCGFPQKKTNFSENTHFFVKKNTFVSKNTNFFRRNENSVKKCD